MVDIALLQSISYMAGALGVFIAAIFYVLNLRINQKNQELMLKNQQQTLETRQAQFMMQLNASMSNTEAWKEFVELMNMEWKDIDDFERKWGTGSNVEASAKRFSLWWRLNFVGDLLQRNLIDRGWLYNMYGAFIWNQWVKWKPIVEGVRKLFSPDYCSSFEYVAEEMAKMANEKGLVWSFPKTMNIEDAHLGKVINTPKS